MNIKNTQEFKDLPQERTWLELILRGLLILIVVIIIYVLSAGPVVGISFWLRETTEYDEFYFVLYAYYPLSIFAATPPFNTLFMWYIEWWVVDVFHTVGPG